MCHYKLLIKVITDSMRCMQSRAKITSIRYSAPLLSLISPQQTPISIAEESVVAGEGMVVDVVPFVANEGCNKQ